MLKAVLHAHSTYSDGEFTLAELKHLFVAQGCSVICITDHAESFDESKLADYIRECNALSNDHFLFIPGLEYECEQRMHILGYGAATLATSLAAPKDPQYVIRHIEENGGLAVIAHPKDAMFPWIESFAVLPLGIETWNSKYDGRYAPRPATFDLLRRLQNRRPGMNAFYGQDLHWKKQFRGLFTQLDCDSLSRDAVLAALSAGAYSGMKDDLLLPSSGKLSTELIANFAATHTRSTRLAVPSSKPLSKHSTTPSSPFPIPSQPSCGVSSRNSMHPDEILYLMYHEIETPGQPLCHNEPGYVRYVLREQDFRQQIEWLQKEGIRGLSVSQALDKNAGKRQHDKRVAITFDDGCASDLSVAIPLLKQVGFGGTFYITLGFLGRPGYLLPNQVREIADAGFDVGCHSMTHPYLSDLDESGLHHEIADARIQLEQITGKPVHNFSCPGGRWTPQVARIAREAGYRSVATSRIAVNRPGDDPFQLGRIAVMRHTTFADYKNLCLGKDLWRLQFRDFIRAAIRRILGNSIYDRIRRQALGDSSDAKTPSE